MTKEVEILATYVGNQPILSILEANLDLDKVSVRRSEYAVKAVIPIEVIITAASIYAFEKLVLDPILDPIAEKFNWVKAVKKLLRPHQPFNITVRISGNDFIEAPLGVDHSLLANVWQIMRNSIEILRAEGLLEETSSIRIVSESDGKLLVIAYRGSRPARQVLISESSTRPIAN